MAYSKQAWKDRIVQFPMRFTDQDGNIITLTESPGEIAQAGTVIAAEWLNHMEDGIADAHTEAAKANLNGAYMSQVSIAASAWALSGKVYTVTVNAAGILLGGYVYTVSPTPETARVSGEAGGVLMSTPTTTGQATFTVPERPSAAVTMVIKREVEKNA